MPQPVAEGAAKPRRAVLSRPQCAVLIAAILAEWAYVEGMLTLMFSAAMGSHTLTDDGAASVSRDWTALVTMRELESIRMRLKIVEKTLIVALPADLREKWTDLSKVLNAAAKDRNTVAHAAWGLSDRYPADLLLENDKGQYMRYSEKDFATMLDRVSKAYVETHDFMHLVLAAQRDGKVSVGNK